MVGHVGGVCLKLCIDAHVYVCVVMAMGHMREIRFSDHLLLLVCYLPRKFRIFQHARNARCVELMTLLPT